MLQIRKKAESVFKHFNEQGNFMLSRGYFKLDNGVFQIVENGGARRFLYALADITIYDDTASGTAETFATDIELYERLVALRYNLLDTASGGFVSDLTSYPIDFPFVGSNTFVLPDNYVVVSVHVNIALQKKVTYSKTGNNLLVIGSLQTGDVVEVRGVVALGSFSGGGGGGGGTWGSITGTLSAQTDLQAALNLKAPKANPTFTGSVVVPNAVNPTEAVNLQQLLSGSLQRTGTTVVFDIPAYYGSRTTPLTGNITLDITGAIIGRIQEIYHNSASVPTITGSGITVYPRKTYQVSALNKIMLEYTEAGKVEVTYIVI